MSLTGNQILLYAADPVDYRIALGAAGVAGIPAQRVTGNFVQAWTAVASGSTCVIAVGAPALNALFFNPCGWANPDQRAGGHTPFVMLSTPQSTLPGKNVFLNAAGATAADTLQLASAFVYFAVHGTLPSQFANYPHAIAPTETCAGSANVACPCTGSRPVGSPTPVPQPAVPWGVDSAAAVTSTLYQCVVSHYGKPVFWGRYIRTVNGVSDGLTAAEVTFLHGQGIKILPIFNNFGSAVGYDNGVAEANAAIAAAKAIHMPSRVVIFADVEGNYAVDEAWIRGWTDTLVQSGYLPGLYHNPISGPFSSAYCTAVKNEPSIATQVILWSNEREPGISTKAQAPAWDPAAPPCAGRVLAWQYGENGNACQAGIDTDLIDPSLLQYLW